MGYWKIKGSRSEWLGLCLGHARLVMWQMRMPKTILVGKYLYVKTI